MTEKNITTSARLDECRRVLLVKHFEEDGEKLIRVPLYGKHGTGKHMVLDADVWRDGRDNRGWPADWMVQIETKSRRPYVMSCRAPIGRFDKPQYLSRLIMNAGEGEGEVVYFKNGNTLDLRRSNLEKMSRAEWGATRRKSRKFSRRQRPFVEVEDDTPRAGTAEEVRW